MARSVAPGVALGVTAGVAIWLGARGHGEISVVTGDISFEATPATPPQRSGDSSLTIRSEDGGEVRLADVIAKLRPSTAILWHRERRVLELRAGGVTVNVEHPGQKFEVRTPSFIAQVIGTGVCVDVDGVSTAFGRAWVQSLDGKDLGPVTGTQRWFTPIPGDDMKPAALAVAEKVVDLRLARARRALVRGDGLEARRAVERLFGLDRDVAAEARTLYAESFLVDGWEGDALQAYETVVRQFDGTEPAERALFAIARFKSDNFRPDATDALRRYLHRYPDGQFANEASDRLDRLAAARVP